MDPISAIFAAYLDVVSASISGNEPDDLVAEAQTLHVEHKGVKVPFQIQQWKINPNSICNTRDIDIEKYSACAMAAKSLFASACSYLESDPGVLLNHRRQKDMYCSAAVNYQPAPMDVDWSQNNSPLADARTKCNLALVGLMSNDNLAARMKKQQACGKYEALRRKQAGG